MNDAARFIFLQTLKPVPFFRLACDQSVQCYLGCATTSMQGPQGVINNYRSGPEIKTARVHKS